MLPFAGPRGNPVPDAARDDENPMRGTRDERDIILDSISEGVFTVNSEWRITSFNRAAEKIMGIPRQEAIGRRCNSIFRSSICETDCALRRTMETGRDVVNRTIDVVNAAGARLRVSISTALLKDEQGQIVGGVETFRDLSAVEALRKELEGRYTFHDMVSRSHRMRELFEILPEVAASGSTVLIEGESGTGKELLARAIHSLSSRARGPLVAVNCGALPDTLLESELFGHKAGAFTDAKKDRRGRFALAEGGTILLDEIGDVSPALQVRLLRVLEEKTYEPLGGSDPVRADVRVITATNQNLDRLVAEKRFRLDLYYRINVVRLRLPPLRERKEDVPLLAEHFIARLNRLQGKTVAGMTDAVLGCLMSHDYPGNVRELENIVEHSFVLCQEGMIEPRHLPEPLRSQVCAACPKMTTSGASLQEIERILIESALKKNDWNRQRTADRLKIARSTLRRRMRSLGIRAPSRRGRPSKQ